MTQSIMGNNDIQEENRLEITLLAIIGFVLFNAGHLVSVFSPLLSTNQTQELFSFGGLRFIMFLFGTLFYFVIYRYVKQRDSFIRSTTAKLVFLVLQVILPCLVLFENFTGASIPFIIIAIAWAFWGISYAFFTCTWVDLQSNLENVRFTEINFWSFFVAICLVIGVLAMSKIVALFLLLSTCIVPAILLIFAPLNPDPDSNVCDEDWSQPKSPFRKNGSFVMVVDGVLISFVACFLILWAYQAGFPPFIMGLALAGMAALFLMLKLVKPALLSLERSQLVFLPIMICGLIVLGFMSEPWSVVSAFVLFVVFYLFDYVNSSILSLRGNLLSISPCYCYSKGRIFIMLGQTLGWGIASFIFSGIGISFLSLFTVIAIGFLCLYITIGTINPTKYPLVDEISQEKPTFEVISAPSLESVTTEAIITRPYKRKCSLTAQSYDLTSRESEILFYLAKGRNAKYIADQLFVAERTIKTHAYHIYQKMDIHSQQELIDIVESMKSDTA